MSIRFGFFTTFFPPFHFGGDAIGVERLVRALARRGHEISVVHDADAFRTLRGPEPDASYPPTDNIKVITLESPAPVVANLLTQQTGRNLVHDARIERVIEQGQFDILWHNNVSLVGGHRLLRKGSALKVYEAHEHWLVCPTHILWRYDRELCDKRECVRCQIAYRRPPQLWRQTGFLAKQAAAVDAFIALSRSSADNHKRFGFPFEMRVLPTFLPDETPFILSAAVAAKPYALFVGRLEKLKGLQDVIPVFREQTEIDLLIAGEGDYGRELRALAGEATSIRFLGRKAPADLASLYAGAAAVLLPSACYEVFPLVALEAFRSGAPIVARNLGPFPEIIEASRAGALFDTPEAAFAETLRLARNPALRAELSARARGAVERCWSETVAMRAYFNLIAETADAKRRKDIASKALELANFG